MKSLFVVVLCFVISTTTAVNKEGCGEVERGRGRVTGAWGMEEVKQKVEKLDSFNIVDYGAVGDGITLNTQAIQKAIDNANEHQDGGIVLVESGFYLSGALEMKSNVFLQVTGDAVLLASHNSDDYPGPWDDTDGMPVFLSSNGAKNIGIIGDGRLDGQAIPFFVGGFNQSEDKYIPITWAGQYGCQGECRPRLVQFIESENILVHGITLQNSPDWTSHYINCTNILIEGVTIYGDYRWPNNDGIDPNSSQNITITHTRIDVGDDNICPKTSYGALKNFLVTDCHLKSRSSGIKFGSTSQGDFYDALFERIWIHNSGRGISIQHRDVGNVWNIEFRDIVIDGVSYQPESWWGVGEAIWVTSIPRDEGHPMGTVSDVRYVNVSGRAENGALFSSRTDTPLSGFYLCDVNIDIQPWHPKFGRRIDFLPPEHDYRPTNVIPDARVLCDTDGIYFENVVNTTVYNSSITFASPRQSWWGACTNSNSSYPYDVEFDKFQCINGEDNEMEL
uniref:Rhamnogalacturonase A/B/Epimerase-like pectate lyase domain-containing protein n=1 Tax=Paramoeba aestuarina TaxID=180227 RepID=A0A7S4KYT8_9EUKA